MPDLRVDPLLSYARRVGDQVQVILEVEGDRPEGADVALRLRGPEAVDQSVTIASQSPGRFRVEALVPADRLGDATWRLRLVDPAAPQPRNLQTRLLVRTGMPVAVLPGRPPNTVLPEPEPRVSAPSGRSPGRRQPEGSAPGVWRRRRRGRGAGADPTR